MLPKKIAKQFVKEAAANILERSYNDAFISAKRAKGKAKRMNPTDIQKTLLGFIVKNPKIAFDETLGMNWNSLGGLLSRGLVRWAKTGNTMSLVPTESTDYEKIIGETYRKASSGARKEERNPGDKVERDGAEVVA